MTSTEIAQLARSWIAYWRAPEDSPERAALSWVTEREWTLVEHKPLIAWELVLQILAADSSGDIQEVLAAGPLEDLLSKHGPVLIEAVEGQAMADPEFARLLGGVWRNSMTDDVWGRVQAAWDRRGWDGSAEA